MWQWIVSLLRLNKVPAIPEPTVSEEDLVEGTVMTDNLNWQNDRQIDEIIIHSSATRPSLYVNTKIIRKWHTDPKPQGRGWSDIGYAYVIVRSGKTELGRDLDDDGFVEDDIGAHAFGWNTNSIGICLVGGVAEDGKTPEANFTESQMAALGALVVSLKQRYPNARVMGHRDTGANKACPSFDVADWLAKYELAA
ncbi:MULTISPECIES: N-acetylmuramoyl-L-alanine amidase [Pseudomonadota]|uniref:N-acetylmuramoyl-L-alanine amidase n=1 Tax=Pseudomonadota TaxID=1224 RepID=UPI002628AB67|nr:MULTISPECIES: N-acetylmuramoyl-L-alanine amidase [Pseudomonadota]